MARNYSRLEQQVKKIRSTIERITPPSPDDEFEDQRQSVLKEMDKFEAYIHGRVTGDGSLQVMQVPGED
jgi:hypothetical protein